MFWSFHLLWGNNHFCNDLAIFRIRLETVVFFSESDNGIRKETTVENNKQVHSQPTCISKKIYGNVITIEMRHKGKTSLQTITIL